MFLVVLSSYVFWSLFLAPLHPPLFHDEFIIQTYPSYFVVQYDLSIILF